ncbi:hypothetical protein [Martelella alba]|uniref:Parallel beta helix pectate lyase-like protein n=1 Tax=Martelella alba TaxID=2590451 RepID=A0ABY2SJV1_9HYPH|nr:hypothetical protein [Martelella alba]TKI05771.1 hypothetical protein FCN80_12580 [Martelella alba]
MRMIKNKFFKKKDSYDGSKRFFLKKLSFILPLSSLFPIKFGFAESSIPISKKQEKADVTKKVINEQNCFKAIIGLLQNNDGLKYIGRCSDISELRKTEPNIIGQRIDVVSYYAGWSSNINGIFGGGEFWYDAADKVSQDDGGSVIVTHAGKRWKRITDQLLPIHYGCVPGGKNDVSHQMLNYINSSHKKVINLSDGPWLISVTINLTKVSKIICDKTTLFIVDSNNFVGKWAIEIGTPGKWDKNRADGLCLEGTLMVQSLNRDNLLNGIYIKGSWLNIEHMRAVNFNGIGIYQDSVWDSTIQRISAELCGNKNSPQIKLGSEGDTHNTTHIMSIQSEQAYHYSLYINVVRDVIDNIHAERTYVLLGDDQNPNDRMKHRNVYILLGNSIINNAIFDASPLKQAPDGEFLSSDKLSIIFNADYSNINTINASKSLIFTNYGSYSKFDVISCDTWFFHYPSSKNTVSNFKVNKLVASSNYYFSNGEINNVLDIQNYTENVLLNFIDISKVHFSKEYHGDINFRECSIKEINQILKPTEGYSEIVFNNCRIDFFRGGSFSRAKVDGGIIKNIDLDDSAAIEFNNHFCENFTFSGISEFTTTNVVAEHVLKWDVPHKYNYPLGKMTTRIGDIQQDQTLIYIKQHTKNQNKINVWFPFYKEGG